MPTALIEAALEGRETIVPGMFTAADIQLGFYEEILDSPGGLDRWPNIRGHLARVRARPAYRLAVAKGGPVRMPGR